MMPIISDRFRELDDIVSPYTFYDEEKNETKLRENASEEAIKVFPEYLKLRKKELWDFNE